MFEAASDCQWGVDRSLGVACGGGSWDLETVEEKDLGRYNEVLWQDDSEVGLEVEGSQWANPGRSYPGNLVTEV